MQVKKFEAVDMPGALELVKREFGSEAVILSTRKVKRGRGVFGIMGRPCVEVTAAADPDFAYREVPDFPKKGRRYQEVGPSPNPLEGDMEELKRMIRSLPHNGVPKMVSSLPQDLLHLYGQMIGNGVDGGLALEIVGEIQEGLPDRNVGETDKVEDFLRGILSRAVNVSDPLGVERGRQKVVAFVGPTGVGKTTTIAKIAAKQVLECKQKVGLITFDTYRIGAIEQLNTYSKIIGIPVEVVLNGRDIQRALEVHRNKDLVLIDTAGRCQKSQSQMSELRTFFSAGTSVETHLVLSATTKGEDLSDIYKRFRIIPIDRLLFTKLDESTTFGTIFNQAAHSKVPLSYFTTGQKVPEDIEVATVKKVSDLILI